MFTEQKTAPEIWSTFIGAYACWRTFKLWTTPCLKKLRKAVFVRTSSNFHQFW